MAANNYVTRYDYDAFGRLVHRHSSGTDRLFLWDGASLVAEIDSTNYASPLVAQYVYWPDAITPLGIFTSAGLDYDMEDDLGNVIGLLGSTGAVDQRVLYDPWGSFHGVDLASSRLRWKGMMWEGDSTQLYYDRARWYDPQLGRFISQDPAGVAGGLNQYVFGYGDPIRYSDYSGEGSEVGPNGEPWSVNDFYCDGDPLCIAAARGDTIGVGKLPADTSWADVEPFDVMGSEIVAEWWEADQVSQMLFAHNQRDESSSLLWPSYTVYVEKLERCPDGIFRVWLMSFPIQGTRTWAEFSDGLPFQPMPGFANYDVKWRLDVALPRGQGRIKWHSWAWGTATAKTECATGMTTINF